MTNIKMKKCILRLKFWSASNLTLEIFFKTTTSNYPVNLGLPELFMSEIG